MKNSRIGALLMAIGGAGIAIIGVIRMITSRQISLASCGSVTLGCFFVLFGLRSIYARQNPN